MSTEHDDTASPFAQENALHEFMCVKSFISPLAQAFSWVDNPAYGQQPHPRR
jgi:hypothetical protein